MMKRWMAIKIGASRNARSAASTSDIAVPSGSCSVTRGNEFVKHGDCEHDEESIDDERAQRRQHPPPFAVGRAKRRPDRQFFADTRSSLDSPGCEQSTPAVLGFHGDDFATSFTAATMPA